MSADVRGRTQGAPRRAAGSGHGHDRGTRLRVGLVAPPWVPVPPTTYGGTEGFLDTLARGLVADGHEVSLFTIGASTCPVERRWVFEAPPEPMGLSLYETVQVRAAYDELGDCDVIHDNTTIGPIWAAATGVPVPVVLTCHGDLTAHNVPLYVDLARWCTIVAISHSQRASAPGVPFGGVVHHGLDAARFAVGDGSGGYAMFLGRLAPEKGAAAAVEIAQRAGVPIRLAAKMREPAEREYFEQFIEPRLGPGVEFLGEITPRERGHQLGGAIALLNPITWAEPFGLVMIEALVAGTPVISYPSGAAPEIVVDGVSGFLCDGVDEAVDALGRVGTLDRGTCRAHVETEFSADRMVQAYEAVYRDVLTHGPGRGPHRAAGPPLAGVRWTTVPHGTGAS